MKSILFLVKSKKSSSTRDRATEYFRFFKKKKISTNIIYLSEGSINYIKALMMANKFDIVFIQRKLLPKYYFFFLRMLSKKIVFDFDDAVFLNTDGTESPKRLDRFTHITKNCDSIFAGNHFLLKHAKKNNTNTSLIHTCLDTSKYKNKTDPKALNLVWVGSKSTSKYLINIIPHIEKLALREKKLKLFNISDVVLKSDKLKIVNINWSLTNQYKYLSIANIGLAPLSYDDWSKGKCSFKMLQYISAGLPVISSNYGMNKEILENNFLGYVAKRNSDWNRYIKLIDKEKNYNYFRNNARKFIRKFDLKTNFEKIYLILKTL